MMTSRSQEQVSQREVERGQERGGEFTESRSRWQPVEVGRPFQRIARSPFLANQSSIWQASDRRSSIGESEPKGKGMVLFLAFASPL